MKPLSNFKNREVRVLFTDIDGTLTAHGRLPSHSYKKIEHLQESGLAVIPVTGRPAGWCELIARLWPVHGVIGENGAFYFRYDGERMIRHFFRPRSARRDDRKKLKAIWHEIRQSVPGAAIASDQFSRLFDLAVDFSEDVSPLSKKDVDKIVAIFKKHGATAKISNIHVNGWFGDHDKVSACRAYAKKEFKMNADELNSHCAFVGDSPNDEPMFAALKHSFAVANIKDFLEDLEFKPAYVTDRAEADGFCEVADRLLALRSTRS